LIEDFLKIQSSLKKWIHLYNKTLYEAVWHQQGT